MSKSDASFDTYVQDFINGFTKYQCKSVDNEWGLGFYKQAIIKNIKGIQEAYPSIKSPHLKQEACDIAHALSKSYQVQKIVFLHHYLFYQNRLIQFKNLVGPKAANKVDYSPSAYILFNYSLSWSKGDMTTSPF